MKTITLKVSDELYDQLKQVSNKTGFTISAIIRYSLLKHMPLEVVDELDENDCNSVRLGNSAAWSGSSGR